VKTYEWLPKFPFVGGLGGLWIYKDLGEYRYRFIYSKNLGVTPPSIQQRRRLVMPGLGGSGGDDGGAGTGGGGGGSKRSRYSRSSVTLRRKRKNAARKQLEIKELLKKY
tara:strand:+ start:1832 stop:2158 length:327 start_codon:yes stop_codon:yes gene_type:complete